MITDIHTHTFPDRIAGRALEELSQKAHIRPFLDATNSALSRSMKEAGIGRSIVLPVATAARQVEKLNDAAAAVNERTPETGIFSFGCIHPDYEGYYEELSRAASLGLKGIKIHPVYQGVDIDDIRFLRIIDRAAQLGLIVITHAGLDVGFPGAVNCSPRMCRHVVDEIGDFPFILAHMGGWNNWDEVPYYLADTGVYLDTAFSEGRMSPLPDGYWKEEDIDMLDPEGFVSLIRKFGAERILFGTDSPWSDQKECLQFISSLPLREDEKELILEKNAGRLLDAQA